MQKITHYAATPKATAFAEESSTAISWSFVVLPLLIWLEHMTTIHAKCIDDYILQSSQFYSLLFLVHFSRLISTASTVYDHPSPSLLRNTFIRTEPVVAFHVSFYKVIEVSNANAARGSYSAAAT
jgi:hypothetical protein